MSVSSSELNIEIQTHSDCLLLKQIFEQRLGAGSDTPETSRLSSGDRTVLISRFIDLVRQLSSLMRTTEEEHNGSESRLDTVLDQLMRIISHALGADRSTLFLYESETNELFSHAALGDLRHEIRFSVDKGIAGSVFRSGESVFIADAYADPRFLPEVDEQTGYLTRSVLCVPLKNWNGRIIGATEVLNKLDGEFNAEDRALLEALTSHAASALESMQLYQDIEKTLYDEAQLLGITTALSSELKLDALLVKIMKITTEVLEADRSTLLLYDDETHELRSKIAQGLGGNEIRIPVDAGIAGTVFTTGRTVNIPNAYDDPRFNPEVDRSTGYSTRSILCVPVVTHSAETIGIIQVLNKRGGPFNERHVKRLKALASQAAIAIENARLFEAVLDARNYSENILQSLSNGVITLDLQRRVTKANPAALRILEKSADDNLGTAFAELFAEQNVWILNALDKVDKFGHAQVARDADVQMSDNKVVHVNLNIEPLVDIKKRPIGYMLFIEDITSEKRVKSTMARYMSRELSERLLESKESILGGQTQEVSILFTDIQDFTGLTENIGAQATVALLNEYFSEMADIVFKHGGILDKYIGDAIMALFGTPFAGPEDADNAVSTAVEMIRAIRNFNRRRQLEGRNPIGIRLGISTGDVVAGNIGSPRRMDYTVIGHNVNVAARMESANSFYGTEIIITDSTLQRLRRSYLIRELDLIRVKGSQTPLAIYQVVDGGEDVEVPNRVQLIETFATGLQHYRGRNWSKAAAHFRDALSICPQDRPSLLYLDRSAAYERSPPDANWDGVWTMTQK